MAFAVRLAARLSGCKSDEAAGFTLWLQPADWLPPQRLLISRSRAAISHDAWDLLLGVPALTEAGLSPAGEEQQDADDHLSASSRRTAGLIIFCADR